MRCLHACAFFALGAPAFAQSFAYEQPMAPAGGTLRSSQLWVDPTGQNDLDSDAIAWEDFEFATDATISRVRWWGQVAPPLGFRIAFYNQDPNTVAVQPDLFAAGSHPISSRTYTTFQQVPAGNGLVRYDLDLAAPLQFAANTRYFVSVVGLTPIAYATWGWASSHTGVHGTFWWQRGLHMFFHLGDERAVGLASASGFELGAAYCAATPNSTGAAAELRVFGSDQVAANAVTLAATGLPQGAFGFFLTSTTTGFVALPPGSSGNLCLGGSIGRFVGPGQLQNSGPTGQIALTVDLGQIPTPTGLVAVAPGETWSFQAWFRDAVGGQSTSNFTRGVSVAFQ